MGISDGSQPVRMVGVSPPKPRLSLAALTLNGFPVCICAMPEIAHPPIRLLVNPSRILEDRKVVIEADDHDLPAVEACRSNLVTWVPGIIEVVEELGIDHIQGMRLCVCSAKCQALPCRWPGRWPATLGSWSFLGLSTMLIPVKAQVRPIVIGIVAPVRHRNCRRKC